MTSWPAGSSFASRKVKVATLTPKEPGFKLCSWKALSSKHSGVTSSLFLEEEIAWGVTMP